MYEVIPLVLGVIIALIVPRFVPADQRPMAYGGLGMAAALAAMLIAGEEWFFLIIDLAEVFVAMGLTLALVAYRSGRRTLRLP